MLPVPVKAVLATTALAVLQSGCGRLQRVKGNEKVDNHSTAMLVLGDSLSTGVFTSPRFELNYGGIFAQATSGARANPTGIVSPTKNQPVRIRQPEEEVSQFGKKAGPLAAEALLKVIEWPELSWSAYLSGSHETPPVQVVIAARNGAQAERTSAEVEAWAGDTKDGKRPRLPAEVYIFFSGDDLCRPSDAQDTMTAPAAYASGIRDGVHKLATAADVNPDGTKVYLVSHLDILQQVTNKSILADKRIHVADLKDHELSCSEFAKNYQHDRISDRFEDKLRVFTYNPMNVCYNMLAHADGLSPAEAKVPLQTLKATLTGYQDSLAALASELQNDQLVQAAKIQVKLIDTTKSLKMVPEDLANDCFHLSNVGQEKLAKAISAGR